MSVCPSQCKPDTLVIHGNEYGETISEDAMRFRLLYSGEIKAHNELRPKGPHKHDIRTAISPQLKRLWEAKAGLRRYASLKGAKAMGERGESYPEGSLYSEQTRSAGIEYLANLNRKQDTRFVPLVISSFCLRCRIDVLLLRPEDSQQHIVQSGDLDNRIKTLFDAMRIPQSDQLVNDGETHFVLLEDDSLITEVSIVSDNLLMLPGKPKVGDSDVFAVIDVQLDPIENYNNDSHWIF